MALWVLIVALLGGAVPADPEAPPPVLASHLKDGIPDPDDIVWMRGAFPGATAAEKADWAAIRGWLDRCFDAGTAKVRSDLQALGVSAAKLPGQQFAAPVCDRVASLNPSPDHPGSWEDHLAANREAKIVFDTFFYGAKLGFESAPFDPAWVNEEARTLLRAVVREQVYRTAVSWSANGGPPLSPAVEAAMMRRLWLMITIEDGKNTAMLKALVAQHGWPTIARVGARASDAAWLIVQHADMDPVFQLQALRLMEPLVATGGVSKANYAYLYDRVMLKLAGTQRYGTQAICAGGKWAPQPIELGVEVDAKRAEVGLDEPVATYIARLTTTFGPCPLEKPVEAPPRAP